MSRESDMPSDHELVRMFPGFSLAVPNGVADELRQRAAERAAQEAQARVNPDKTKTPAESSRP